MDFEKAINALRLAQNQLASSRDRCDESEGELWDTYEAAIAALSPSVPAEAVAWQPIETAPKHYTPILLKQDETVGEGWYSSHLRSWEFAASRNVMRRNPTHWMPLPQGDSLYLAPANDEAVRLDIDALAREVCEQASIAVEQTGNCNDPRWMAEIIRAHLRGHNNEAN